jgi:RHS repeat-associated protein
VIESVTYTYDAAGNRLTANRTSGTATALPNAVQASYDAANELTVIASGATQSLTYDQNGNLTNDGTNTYTWDARNRLVGISGGVSASFSYDALGRRTSKTINGVTTGFLYDGNDIIAEMQGGAITAFYLRGLNIDEPFIRITAAGAEFYHTDALGSTLALTNDAGQVTTTYSYESFGKTTITGTSSNPFQYTGRENDGSGLYYYRARYYHPVLSRFLGEDPLHVGSLQLLKQRIPGLSSLSVSISRRSLDLLNPYIYVSNSPLRFTDRLGLLPGVSQGLGQVFEQGLKLRIAAAGAGAASTVVEDKIPTSVKNTEFPIVGGTVGDTLDAVSLIGGAQTVGLGAAIATAGGGAALAGGTLVFFGGFEIGTAVNNQLDKTPGGNPVGRFFELTLGCRKC